MKLLGFLILFSSFAANAVSLPINSVNSDWLMPLTFTENYDFEGIVALSNCSGSLIQLEGVSDANAALIMTNGHCLEGGFVKPGAFVYKRPSTRTFTLLSSNANPVGKVTAVQVVYGTMTKTDMAIYLLNETYADIKAKFGIRPLVLASTKSMVNDDIEVISGHWKRGYTCAVEAFIPELREAGYIWKDSLRYSRPGCETIGGTSGSPILKAGTKTVIGINNTGNDNGESCSLNNPCEVDKNGNVTANLGFSYGQQTHWVYSCLTTTNEIDLAVPGCQLPH